jgi:FtsP/CotA-like multicopper oxidase with cupredoxin domain
MTELLIRTVSRLPLQRLARPSAVLAFALPFAYLGGLWLIWLHVVEGGHERNEPSLLVHALRDGTVALPLICVAVWVGIVIGRRLITRWGAEDSRLLAAGVLAVSVAVAAGVAQGLTNPAHASLFGAHHGGHEPSLVVHMLRDGLLALFANALLAIAVTAALLRTRPWAVPQVERWTVPRARRPRWALHGTLALLFIAPLAIMGQNRAEVAAAGAGAGLPCPSSAPVKSFDVQAIDVDIPLNRWGDHDPSGKMYVLTKDVAAVRAEEASRHVSFGLKDNDPIQPLVIRANLGDCVEINFTNNATGGDYGAHIDGLAFNVDSSGDNIGNNDSSSVAKGASRSYRFWVPRDPDLEGAHYLRPGPGFREPVSHGLFGSLSVEPAGSTYRDMVTGDPIDSGWQADIMPGGDKKAFREYVQLYHEVGNEIFDIPTTNPAQAPALPRVDPHTESYRPGSRAINYRSEPFMNRLDKAPTEDSHGYSSYTFADPPTPMPRGYQGDPTKIRILHAGTEMFHVFHLHGGGIRWRLNPHADKTYDYADTGLNKHPKAQDSSSARLDSQAFGPGESYDLEIEGGAGGVQQGAGEFLFHCHIAEHYVSGMWSFWRVFDTLQPDLEPLPDRAAPPAPVSSEGLIGKTMPDGTTLTAENLDAWIRPQLPTPGTRIDAQDAAVWDWTRQGNDYLGEPEDTAAYVNYTTAQDRERVVGHPALMPGDVAVGPQDRPEIKFNPTNGRPAFPLLRPHLGKRPPFSGNGHSGAPWLGENGDQPKTTPAGVPDPWAGRSDGICPAGAPVRHFNIVALDVNTPVTRPDPANPAAGKDADGKVYVLAQDVDAVLNGTKEITPLAIRGNIGDCIAVTFTSRLSDAHAFGGFSKVNLHIHHVQFDTQASDGVISGLSYEQSIRPFSHEDLQLAAASPAGDTTVEVTNPDPARAVRLGKIRPGVWIAVGQGTEDIEVRQVKSVSGTTITLEKALDKAHAADEWAGTEFVQSRWYPDVQLDNIFWHDHVDGIHTWGHGLVGQLIIEPKDSTYHDPETGTQVKSGTYVDIHTNESVAQGLISGSFRELALWTIDESPVTDSTLNLRAEPFASRPGDPSQLFSSYAHGDPYPIHPQAYAGDPFVIRTINVGPSVDTLHLDGHRFFTENRFVDSASHVIQKPVDTIHYGISERNTVILDGGAGGKKQRPGDYLFFNGIARRFQQGAWSLLRVLDGKVPALKPLPGHPLPANDATVPTGNAPPASTGPGNPCPAGAPDKTIAVSAVDVRGALKGKGVREVFAPTAEATAIAGGTRDPEPFVAHVAKGDCLTVNFTNQLAVGRASFHVSKLDHTPDSSGVDVGFNAEQTVAPGGTKTYRYYVDDRKITSALVTDMGGQDTGALGLYGSINVAPEGATFTDPVTGAPRAFGTQVDVHVPGSQGYRDFTLALADADPIIGGSFMPYPVDVKNPALINYRAAAARGDDANTFSSKVHGDPSTPLLTAYAGDPTKVHFLTAPGSEQMHVFGLGGQYWAFDPEIPFSQAIPSQGVGPHEILDGELVGGAGGLARSRGDFFYGDVRRPFTQAGMWGLMRVMSDPSCPIKPLDGLTCKGQDSMIFDPPAAQELPRPGEVPGEGFPDNPSPGALAAAPSTDSSSSDTGLAKASGTAVKAVRRLRIAKRLKLRTFGVQGEKITVDVPSNTTVLELKLTRRSRGRARTVLAGVLRVKKVPSSGRLVVWWKPGQKAVSRLLAGSDILRVRAGRDRKRLGGTLSAPVRLLGPRLRAPVARRR